MTFVDTGAWYAMLVPSDPDHTAADAWLAAHPGELITTDYILDETITLLMARGQKSRALNWGERVFSGQLCRIHYVTETDVLAAWTVFRQYLDKKWSFTDCVSKVTIQSLAVKTALSFDRHFHQFGNVVVVP